MRAWPLAVPLVLVLLLTGCTPAPVVRDALFVPLELPVWTARGRVALFAEGEGWHAGFEWRQQGEDLTLTLNGPFGQGALRLLQVQGRVRLIDGQGAVREAESVESLVAGATGVALPVSGLRYWLLGRPAPDRPHRWLEGEAWPRLEQDGWTIDYRVLADVGGHRLPTRIRLVRPGMKLKLVIDAWDV